MARPRVHDPDRVLDAAESLVVACGPAAVTIRAISAAVGVSNGAVYHTFGSRMGLLARAWLRGIQEPVSRGPVISLRLNSFRAAGALRRNAHRRRLARVDEVAELLRAPEMFRPS
jgi:AcrR family transcriptional regulator